MNIQPTRPLDIEGTEYAACRMTENVFCAIASAVLGLMLWRMEPWPDPNELVPLFRFLAVLCFVAALSLPYDRHTCLSFAAREINSVTYYAWFRVSRVRRPLTDFSGIVVRHVCHSGGEGPDTYTGSVGLKPADGQSAFWVKEFATSADEIPRAAYDFASALQSATGLPFAPEGGPVLGYHHDARTGAVATVHECAFGILALERESVTRRNALPNQPCPAHE